MRITKLDFYEGTDKESSLKRFYENELYGEQDVLSRKDRMKKIVSLAIENELTERQKQCISMRYLKTMPVCDIANKLEISSATVYKHIRKGIKAIKHCSVYI